MAYQRVEWQSGTKVADGYVEINGTKHTTVQPQYSGATPINPASLNIMDKGIFDNSQDIEQNTQDIQENRNILNGLASAGCLYVEDIQCRNLFNKNTITEGVCLNGDGTTREASNFCISDYIPVKMLKKYTYQGLTNVGNETYSEFYSSNKTFISSFQQQTAINTITIPIGAAYVRFSIRTSSSDQNTFQIEPGEVATDYTEHKEITPTIENSLDSDSTENVPSVHAVKEQIDSLNSIVLYNNSTGSKETITLNDSTENYEYIEIFYKNNDGQFNSLKVYEPNGKKIILMSVTPAGGTTNYLKSTRMTISQDKITVDTYLETGLATSGISVVNSNQHYITRIIGYRPINN